MKLDDAAPILCAGVTVYKALKQSNAKAGNWVAVRKFTIILRHPITILILRTSYSALQPELAVAWDIFAFNMPTSWVSELLLST